MDILEKVLHDLHASVKDAPAERTDPNSLINNIDICFQGFDEDEMDSAISLLLTSQVPPNIFFYFDATIRTKDRDVIKSKIAAFKLLAGLIKQAVGVNAHTSVILDGCMNIFSREDSNEVKSNSLGPIKNLFRDRTQYPDVFSEDCPPPHIFYETFTKELLSNKQAKGLRAELVKTLGLLLHRVFTTDHQCASGMIEDWTRAVADRAYDMLSTNILGNKEPDLPQLSGALSALDKCLFIEISPCVDITNLWKMVLKVASSVSNSAVARFAHIRKALRLVCNHGAMFNKVIGLNAQQAYNVFISCLRADKDALKKYAETAVLEVLRQIALYASSSVNATINSSEYSDLCMKTAINLSSKYITALNVSATSAAEYDVNLAGGALLMFFCSKIKYINIMCM